jgi:hypothetical protein
MQFKWFPNKPTNRPERQSLAFHNADLRNQSLATPFAGPATWTRQVPSVQEDTLKMKNHPNET